MAGGIPSSATRRSLLPRTFGTVDEPLNAVPAGRNSVHRAQVRRGRLYIRSGYLRLHNHWLQRFSESLPITRAPANLRYLRRVLG